MTMFSQKVDHKHAPSRQYTTRPIEFKRVKSQSWGAV